jgi:hypothetical protein
VKHCLLAIAEKNKQFKALILCQIMFKMYTRTGNRFFGTTKISGKIFDCYALSMDESNGVTEIT